MCPYLDDSLLNKITDIIVPIISILNLFFIVYIYKSNKKRDDQNRKNDRKSIWFRQLILEPHVENIPKFYDNIISLIESFDKWYKQNNLEDLTLSVLNKEISSKVNDLNILITDFNHKFIDSVYSIDEKFASELININEMLRDFLTENIGNTSKPDSFNLQNNKNRIYELKIDFLKKLHNFDLLLV